MAPAAPTAPTVPAAFSADSIAGILNNIQAAAAPAAPPGAAGFSADSIASMLRNMPQQQAQQTQQTQLQRGSPPLDLMQVISLVNPWDREMQARLSEFLPEGAPPDTVAETLSTPQLQQAAASFTHALNGLGAQGLIAEMKLNPSGYGVEAFLRALQDKADADKRAKEGGGDHASTSSAPMDLS